MRFLNWTSLNWCRQTDRTVRVTVVLQRTPERWHFKWYANGGRRYSKRELLDMQMQVEKFVNRLPVKGRKLESHTLSLWV